MQQELRTTQTLITPGGQNIIDEEIEAGYEMPITGAKHNFWPKMYTFTDKIRLDTFLKTSGRTNGDIVGTNFCESLQDDEFIFEIANDVNLKTIELNTRPPEEKKRVNVQQKILLRWITRQYPNLLSKK